MKIRNLIKAATLCLVLGTGVSIVQPARGQFPPALFQYAIFYNGLLEFSDCSTMTVNGRVNCNSNIYVGTTSGSSLTFNGFVTAAGIITNSPNAGYVQSSWTGTTTYNGTPSPGWGTGYPAFNLPIGTGSYAEMIKLPPAGEATNSLISEFRYYNKAGLVILVTNITTALNGTNVTNVLTSVMLKSSMWDTSPLVFSYTNNLPTNTPALYTNWLQMTTNWSWFGASNWLTTNATFYDSREGRTNHVTQIDIGKFGSWIATNTNALAKWNPSIPFNGVIYVGDFRATNSMYMDAVRLTNGQTIPPMGASNIANFGSAYGYNIPGMTVATINPLYVAGLFNCPSNSNISSTNTLGTQPCSFVCDALTLLSPAWVDAASFAEASAGVPVSATADTVNAAIVAGNVPSTGTGVTQYCGGVPNLPRLLENWSSSTLWLNTSLVNLYPSMQATKQFQQPGTYYSAPTRHFSFDQNFNYLTYMPPGTPLFSLPRAVITVSNLSQSYSGTPKSVSVSTLPIGLSVALTYNGSSNAPINVGSYQVIATVVDPIYTGSATNTLVVSNALATVTIGNLSQVFDGTPKSISYSVTPSGLPVNVTYNGNLTPPTLPGTYPVIAIVNASNYVGGTNGSLVIAKAAATIVESNLSQIYDGTAKTISVATVPSSLGVNVTYNGSATAPVNAGNYVVVGTVNDVDYQGAVTNALTINPAPASVGLNNLLQTFDALVKIVGVTTSPNGLSVAVTYNGSAVPPTNAGNYAVTGTIVDPNYQGGDTETLVVSQASATLTFTNLSQTYDGTAKSVSPVTVPTNLLVSITYDDSTNAPTNAGSYSIAGTVADPNYQGSATNTFVIGQAVASVTFSNLLQTYDGTAKSVLAVTVPSGLAVDLTYIGSTNAPTNAGSYLVIGMVDDPNYQGSATNTLVIAPPAPPPITLGGSTVLADGTFQLSFTNTPGLSFSVLATADPSQPMSYWPVAGSAVEISPGQYQFIDTQATNNSQQFYFIRSP